MHLFANQVSIPAELIDPSDIYWTVRDLVADSGILSCLNINTHYTPQYDRIALFTILILFYAERGYTSLRELESFCRHDIRAIHMLGGLRPSYETFHRFIRDCLSESIEEIFGKINQYIISKVPVDTSTLYVDGTKFEANANKNTFIWRQNTERNRKNTLAKAHKLLSEIKKLLDSEGIPFDFSILYDLDSPLIIRLYYELGSIIKELKVPVVYGKGKRKKPIQRMYDQLSELVIKLLNYDLEFDLLESRNSCSKTDPDATFMHMKYDYYCNTGVFKPGYNSQFGVSDHLILAIYTGPEANDTRTLIPLLENYQKIYNHYPENVTADAGYSSCDNYRFCSEHEIQSTIKFVGYNAEKKEEKRRIKKDTYKARNFRLNEEGKMICPEGHEMRLIAERLEKRGRIYPQLKKVYEGTRCSECPMKSKCTKSKENRKVSKSPELDEFQEDFRKQAETEEGKERIRQRSIQSEGVFGQLKQDYKYTRLRRRGNPHVKMEIFLVAIGHNIRRLQTLKAGLKDKESELQA